MSAFLIHSKDYSLPEIFLESQIKIAKPDKVNRFSFKDADFQELAGKIFNFSLFDGRTIYFLDNAEKLTKKEVAFIKDRIDFNRLSGTYIFNLISKTYWLKTPNWENIKGLKIKELKFTVQDIARYIKDYTGKELPKDTVEYIAGLYYKMKDFKAINDAALKASLLYPEREEISLAALSRFLEQREPPEIKYLYERIKERDIRRAIETVMSLKEQGYKEERILLSVIFRLGKDASEEEADFIVSLENSLKTGQRDAYALILDLIFYFGQKDLLDFRYQKNNI